MSGVGWHSQEERSRPLLPRTSFSTLYAYAPYPAQPRDQIRSSLSFLRLPKRYALQAPPFKTGLPRLPPSPLFSPLTPRFGACLGCGTNHPSSGMERMRKRESERWFLPVAEYCTLGGTNFLSNKHENGFPPLPSGGLALPPPAHSSLPSLTDRMLATNAASVHRRKKSMSNIQLAWRSSLTSVGPLQH